MSLRRVILVAVILAASLGFLGYVSLENISTLNEVGLMSALVGIALAILVPMVSDWRSEPDFEILANESASNANPEGPKLLNVIVRNKRNLMVDTRAKVTFFFLDGTTASTSGKWGNQPEPVLQLPPNLMPPGSKPNSAIFQGWLTTLLRSMDIPHEGEDYVDFAVKHPGEPDFYMFDAWSYATDWRGDKKKIANQKKVRVVVEVRTANISKSKEFFIENPSTSVADFKLKDVSYSTKQRLERFARKNGYRFFSLLGVIFIIAGIISSFASLSVLRTDLANGVALTLYSIGVGLIIGGIPLLPTNRIAKDGAEQFQQMKREFVQLNSKLDNLPKAVSPKSQSDESKS